MMKAFLSKFSSAHGLPARVIWWGLLGIMTAGWLALGLCAAPLDDDWIYRLSTGSTFPEFWFCLGRPVSRFPEALESIYYHFIHSNGRLTDKLLILFSTVWQPALGRLLCTLSFGVGIYYLARLCFGSLATRRPLSLALLLWLLMLLLPWQQSMLSLACYFNYLLPCGLSMWVIARFLSGGRSNAWVCALAFIAGAMHEGFSLGLLAGMALMFLCGIVKAERGRIALSLSYLAGTSILMLMPGTWVRMNDAPTDDVSPEWLLHTLLTMPGLMLFLASLLIFLCRRRRKGSTPAIPRATLLMLSATGLGSIAVGLITHQSGRAYWFGEMLLIGSSLMLLSALFKLLRQPGRVIASVAGGLLAAWFLGASIAQARFARETEELEQAALRNPGKQILWVDAGGVTRLSPWMLRIVQPPQPELLYNLEALGAYGSHFSGHELLLPLPTRFRGKHYTGWDSLPGNMQVYGSYPAYYAPRLRLKPGEQAVECRLTFDIAAAPLHPANILLKIKGVKEVTANFRLQVSNVPKSRIAPEDTLLFLDPATGRMPDTLRFLLLRDRPRPLLYAPLKAANQ